MPFWIPAYEGAIAGTFDAREAFGLKFEAMFCPACGTKDNNANQFCRACGADLRTVRTAISVPDAVTASAAGAREEIGRAVAAKIREARSAEDLASMTENVLPEIEKFLESPEERRLRRMRAGTITACVGLGVAIGLSAVSGMIGGKQEEFLFLAGLGVVTFFIGVAFLLNGYFLSLPKKEAADHSSDADRQRELDAAEAPPPSDYRAPELPQPTAQTFVASVTEHTTKHLEKEER